MNRELLNLLIQTTEKSPQSLFDETEQKLKSNMLDAHELLTNGGLITVRADTSCKHFPKHRHSYVEIVYMCQGKTTHIVNGDTVILNEGEFLFLNQNCTQENLPSEKNSISVNFIVNPSFFSDILDSLGTQETLLRRFIIQCLKSGELKPNYLHFHVADVLPVQNLAENLIWNLLHGSAEQNNLNEETMKLLFLQLLNNTDSLEYGFDDDEIIPHVMDYIDRNYADGSLSELAHSMFYDFNALSKYIKRATGKNYTELVQEKRMSQACLLLRSTNLGITQIAQKVGYENASYFHRLFYKNYGLSPKKYRDSLK